MDTLTSQNSYKPQLEEAMAFLREGRSGKFADAYKGIIHMKVRDRAIDLMRESTKDIFTKDDDKKDDDDKKVEESSVEAIQSKIDNGSLQDLDSVVKAMGIGSNQIGAFLKNISKDIASGHIDSMESLKKSLLPDL